MKKAANPKKLLFDKKFIPASIAEEDELYPNGIFVFNITKLIAFIQANPNQVPLEEVEVAGLRMFEPTTLKEETVQKANTKIPIILAEISPGRFNVIDGNHRLKKAIRDGLAKIPAYRLLPNQHVAFLTSEKAYKSYIEYWNSKVDDLDE